jgi:plasmid stabilization system protein ParE
MKPRYSTRATNDLIAIADYLIERSPAGARAVEAKIRATVDALCAFPGSGRPVRNRPQVRVMPVVRFPYLIFYTATAHELVVLHVRHGARDSVNPEEL